MSESVVLSKGDSQLTAIATCLLLQASILGAGWLLQGWCSPAEPLQGHDLSQAQAGLGNGAGQPRGREARSRQAWSQEAWPPGSNAGGQPA